MEVDTPSRDTSKTQTPDPRDPDPIIASYNVFTNPPLPGTRKLLILQHPNKQGALKEPYPTINEVRIKPGSGMIEVDVPFDYLDHGYDRDKGMKWGQALQRSIAAKNGGSHGLAGGFGVGVPAGRNGRGRGESEREVYDWNEAVRRDQVLRTQTLGGMYRTGSVAAEEGDSRWMVGVFKGENLYLTPATSDIQLRPQLHHLDALTEQERLTRPRDGPVGKESAPGPTPAPRAITMTVRSASSGNEVTTETMTDRLKHVQLENWQKLKYVGDQEDAAWDLYEQTLLYRGSGSAAAAAEAQGDVKGKGKEKTEEELERAAAKLKTGWAEEDFLRAVAGQDRGAVLEGYGSTAMAGIQTEHERDGDVEFVKKEEPLDHPPMSDSARKAPSAAAKGKARATASSSGATGPSGRRKTVKTEAAASQGSAMEID